MNQVCVCNSELYPECLKTIGKVYSLGSLAWKKVQNLVLTLTCCWLHLMCLENMQVVQLF